MTTRNRKYTPSVTGSYILAGCLVILLWFGIGLLLLPIMLVLAVLHAWYGLALTGMPRSHHLWLARHHLWATLALVSVSALPIISVPLANRTDFSLLNSLLDTLLQAPNPIATFSAALPALGLPQIFMLGLLAFLGWLLVTLWLTLRLVSHWLRWVDRRQA